MDNLSALRGLCNAICNTFYPDTATMKVVLFNEGISPEDNARSKDAELFKVAVRLVRGYVESSRSENGVSTGVNASEVDRSIRMWCSEYGLDADDYVLSVKTVEDCSDRW